jgi:hypothetical protein
MLLDRLGRSIRFLLTATSRFDLSEFDRKAALSQRRSRTRGVEITGDVRVDTSAHASQRSASVFGREITGDLKADADFDESRSSPGHDSVLLAIVDDAPGSISHVTHRSAAR